MPFRAILCSPLKTFHSQSENWCVRLVGLGPLLTPVGVWLSTVLLSDLYALGLNNKNYLLLANLVNYCCLSDVKEVNGREGRCDSEVRK